MLQSIKKFAAQVLAVVTGLMFTGLAMAQTTGVDPFTTAMTEATTKVGTYAAALVGLAAVSVVFMIAIKYVKKLPRAA